MGEQLEAAIPNCKVEIINFNSRRKSKLPLDDKISLIYKLMGEDKQNIFVSTKDGDIRKLPSVSTALDFAYAVHTDLGNHCSSITVNGKIVSFDHALKPGDKVEVIISSRANPTYDWLNKVNLRQ